MIADLPIYLFVLDRSPWPHNGADRVSCAEHLRIFNRRIKSTRVHYNRARRPGQQGQWLLPAVWWPLQWDEVAEENKKWVVLLCAKNHVTMYHQFESVSKSLCWCIGVCLQIMHHFSGCQNIYLYGVVSPLTWLC